MSMRKRFEDIDFKRVMVCGSWGLYMQSTPKDQHDKLMEEAEELSKAITENDIMEVKDGIGDCMVCLGNIAQFYGLSIMDCYDLAVTTISKRKGKMIDGKFVKQ